MAKLEGKSLGPYRVISQIGAGGMATIYKAYQPSMDRTVALKVLPEYYAQDPQFVERFYREARTIARLEHPNILPVYDFGEQDGIAYLVMRFLEGGTLQELMDKQRFSLHQTADLLVPICSALDYAHRKGIIHRDVKPSNVLIDREGMVYLSDFGIAKVLESSSRLTQTGAAMGTPAYMSPEQCTGGAVDKRSDIYSLGVILYEMAVGKVPFQADTPMAVLFAHVHDPLPLPRSINADISEALQNVILKAMAKNPDDRYQSAAEMGAALRRATPPEEVKLPEPQPAAQTIPAAPLPTQSLPEAASPGAPEQIREPQSKPAPIPRKTIVVNDNEKQNDILHIPVSGKLKSRILMKRLFAGGLTLLIVVGLASLTWLLAKRYFSTPTQTLTAASTTTIVSQTRIETIQVTDTLLPTRTWTITVPPPTPVPTATIPPTNTPGPILQVGSTQVSPKDGMLMVYVPAGSFLLGSVKSSDPQAQNNELPQQVVSLDAFWIDQTEITNAMYNLCIKEGACLAQTNTRSSLRINYAGNTKYANYPVVYVSWENANKYCQWAGRRLPTEAEWEKSARGTDGRIYPWGNTAPSCDLANIAINGNMCVGDTSQVGFYTKGASPYGALDMAGNVWEWTVDWYDANYYINMPLSNPAGPDSGKLRVLRGGAFVLYGRTARSADRAGYDPAQMVDRVGFRCASSP